MLAPSTIFGTSDESGINLVKAAVIPVSVQDGTCVYPSNMLWVFVSGIETNTFKDTLQMSTLWICFYPFNWVIVIHSTTAIFFMEFSTLTKKSWNYQRKRQSQFRKHSNRWLPPTSRWPPCRCGPTSCCRRRPSTSRCLDCYLFSRCDLACESGNFAGKKSEEMCNLCFSIFIVLCQV